MWIIEPRDPLIFRDGRPFDPFPGARARSLEFPFPSTIIGAIRTRDGLDEKGLFQESRISELMGICMKGPLLVELDPQGEITRWLVPAPADALLLGSEPGADSRVMLKPLVPLQLPEGAQTNLPEPLKFPVGLTCRDPRKPFGRPPRYWYWEFFEQWLLHPQEEEVSLDKLGHSGPVRESRMHVGIKSETGTADEERGALFQTQGLEFTCAMGKKLSETRRLGLAVATDASRLKPGLGSLGGERRLAFWRPSVRELPPVPEELVQKIVEQKSCRLILLTPAYFEKGWKPSWLLKERVGVRPSLKAAALKRYETVSGWDLEKRKPKPTRRLAPAGTVYFLKLEGEEAAVRKWVKSIWLENVSDGEQERRDGFGLAVLGTWDGKPKEMEV